MCVSGVYVCWWCIYVLLVYVCIGGVYVFCGVYVCWWCICVLVVYMCVGGVYVC